MKMIDVGGKEKTERVAVARGVVVMAPATVGIVSRGESEKGDVLAAARLAGVMAAKKTHELIPLCHPLALTKVEVDIVPDNKLPGLAVRATAKLKGQTGVEMEALTAAAVGLLTVYDMLKAVDRGMTVERLRLEAKSGGKSGAFRR